jgi:Kef-type K+ transport system membrane component KefB
MITLTVLAQAKPPSLPGDQVLAFVLLDIAIILVAARLVGALFVRLKQPRVVGEIVAGVLLGPSLLGPKVFSWDNPWGVLACDRSLAAGAAGPSITDCLFPVQARSVLGILGQIGLLLFMFLVGLELDLSKLKGRIRAVVAVGVGVVVVPVLAGFPVGAVLFGEVFTGNFADPARRPSEIAFILMIAAMLSVTAFPVAARILQEKGLTETRMATTALAVAAVVTTLMFLLLGVARGVAREQAASSHALRLLGLVVLLVVAFAVVRPLLARFSGGLANGAPLGQTQFVVFVAVAIAFGYAADRIGVNVILGGFIAGTVMPARPQLLPQLRSRLSDIVIAVFLPIFLAVSGLQTDMTKLTGSAFVGLALFLVAGVVAKWGGGLLFGRLGGLSWGEGNVIGVLMNCRGLLVLVVALEGLNSGVLTPVMQVGGVLMALITTAMTGPLVDWALRRAGPGLTPSGSSAGV